MLPELDGAVSKQRYSLPVSLSRPLVGLGQFSSASGSCINFPCHVITGCAPLSNSGSIFNGRGRVVSKVGIISSDLVVNGKHLQRIS